MGDWMQWITNLVADGPNGPSPVEEAAICGFANGQESVWASTPGLAGISVDEIKEMAGKRNTFPINGAFLAKRKCRLIRDQLDDDGINCCDLKTAAGSDGSNPVNVCVGKSKTAFVIAFGKKDVSGGAIGDKVYKTTDYLRKCNM